MTSSSDPSNSYSANDLLSFLDHAADRGLMPTATAQALASACRTVFALLTNEEKHDVRRLDLDVIARRFQNKRAHDFTPESLKTYDSRVRRAVKLFVEWRQDPAHFRVATRSTIITRRQKNNTLDAATRTAPPEDTSRISL